MTGTEKQRPAVHFLGLVGPLACRSRVSVPLMLATPFRQQSNVTTGGTNYSNYCLLGGIKQWSVSLVRWCQPHVWGIQRLLIDCSLHMNTNKSRGPQLQHKHLLNVFCHNYTWIGNVHAVFLWNRTHLCFEGWDQLLENRDRIRETFWLKTSQQYLSFMMS